MEVQSQPDAASDHQGCKICTICTRIHRLVLDEVLPLPDFQILRKVDKLELSSISDCYATIYHDTSLSTFEYCYCYLWLLLYDERSVSPSLTAYNSCSHLGYHSQRAVPHSLVSAVKQSITAYHYKHQKHPTGIYISQLL